MSVILGLFSLQLQAAEHYTEEVVVTGPFHKIVTESALPVGVLSGEELSKRVANSLGETLKGELGVHSASFGPGVGQPVIRGQSGKRVQILQNSVFVADAANLSPDHANGIEPLLADSIEVVRGPATLLYGSGAIGGVINVLDQRIPNRLFDSPELVIEQSHNSVSDEDKSVFGLNASKGKFSLHVDAYHRQNNDVEVPGIAVDSEGLEALEALAGITHDAGGEEEAPVFGRIENSSGEGKGGTLGFSWIEDNGYIGFSYNRFESEYGLPGGSHEHHAGEDDAAGAGEEAGEEIVRLALEQNRYDLKADRHFNTGLFETIDFQLGYTDYEHRELEIDATGLAQVGTQFLNSGFDSRLTLKTRDQGGWQGAFGLQLNDTQFSAIGAEAFIPETDIQNAAVFAVGRKEMSNLTLEMGARLERAALDPGRCDKNETVFSGSASLLHDTASGGSWLVGLGRTERAPTVEERYSNIALDSCGQGADLVTHAATNLIEIGALELETEVSHNLELGYRFPIEGGGGEISAFYNQVADYVFLDLTGGFVDDTQIARYEGRDATFYGVEGSVDFPVLQRGDYSLDARVFGDMVRGSFDSGGNVPRLSPARAGFDLSWYKQNLTAELSVVRMFSQNRVDALELATDAYTAVSLYADRHWSVANGGDLTVFAKLDNLLDEEIRNHVSFLKLVAPEPGRALRVGVRFRY